MLMEPFFALIRVTDLTLFTSTNGMLRCDNDLSRRKSCYKDDTSVGFEGEMVWASRIFLN